MLKLMFNTTLRLSPAEACKEIGCEADAFEGAELVCVCKDTLCYYEQAPSGKFTAVAYNESMSSTNEAEVREWVIDNMITSLDTIYLLSRPLTSPRAAIGFINQLHAVEKLFHFDDDPAEIFFHGTEKLLFTNEEMPLIRERVNECFKLLDDPFQYFPTNQPDAEPASLTSLSVEEFQAEMEQHLENMTGCVESHLKNDGDKEDDSQRMVFINRLSELSMAISGTTAEDMN